MTTRRPRTAYDRIALAVSIATLVVLAVVVVLQVLQNRDADKQRDALAAGSQANRATICAAARIISLSPVRQFPGESDNHYLRRLDAAGIFLHLAEGIDCAEVLAAYGIRLPPTKTGGDAKRPQTGSQLPRPGRRRPHPPGRQDRRSLGHLTRDRPDRPVRRDSPRPAYAVSSAR